MVTWYVQSSLGSTQAMSAIERACEMYGHGFELVPYIPFSVEPPDVAHDGLSLFYGSPQFVRLVCEDGRWSPGAFWDDETFRVSKWWPNDQQDLLNHRAELMPLIDLVDSSMPDSSSVFVRPERDLKEFGGEVMTMGALRDWARLALQEDTVLDPQMMVSVGPPIEIDAEWRCIVVQGKVVTASMYQRHGQMKQQRGAPPEVVRLCERLARSWSPAPVFVLDIAAHEGRYSVIELNGFNSSGFYAACVNTIVREVSAVVNSNYTI